uniref:Uncharacterized protein n=1 Tax=Solanum tuberosum TaxID=4113 RepID=M1DBY3_SOLTU
MDTSRGEREMNRVAARLGVAFGLLARFYGFCLVFQREEEDTKVGSILYASGCNVVDGSFWIYNGLLIRSTPIVTTTQAPSTQPIVAIAPRMDEASSIDAFFHSILDPVMTGTEHELLTKFLKLKFLKFHGTKNVDALEFILDCYERLHKLGVV